MQRRAMVEGRLRSGESRVIAELGIDGYVTRVASPDTASSYSHLYARMTFWHCRSVEVCSIAGRCYVWHLQCWHLLKRRGPILSCHAAKRRDRPGHVGELRR